MKRVLVIAASLFITLLLAAAAAVGWFFWQQYNVPFFTVAQQVTPDGRFSNTFLSTGGDRYVSTRAEFSLDLLPSTSYYPVIGRTSDDQNVRAIPGNEAYVTLSGFMSPAVIFRSESVPPVDLAELPIAELRYSGEVGGQPVQKATTDADLIAEVVGRMQTPPVALPEAAQVYAIRLLSPDLPGLAYSSNVLVDSSGKTYFAPPYDYENGVEAGPLFMQWIR